MNHTLAVIAPLYIVVIVANTGTQKSIIQYLCLLVSGMMILNCYRGNLGGGSGIMGDKNHGKCGATDGFAYAANAFKSNASEGLTL